MTTRNDEARAELSSEMAKLGLTPAEATNPNKEEAEKEIHKLESEPEPKPEVKEEPKVEKQEVKPEAKVEEKERPKKYIPIDQYTAEKAENKQKFEEMQKTIDELKKGTSTKEEVNTDVKAFAESLGVEDPEVLEKIITFVTTGTKKTIDELKTKIEDLSSIKAEKDLQAQVKQEEAKFNSEWDSFVKSDSFKNAYPDATPEQIAEARTLMDERSHSKDWAKYDLDYIFFKNRADFDDSLGTKKFKGSGTTTTQGITEVKKSNGAPKLSDSPTAEEIRAYDAYMGTLLNRGSLAEKPNERL